MYIRYNCTYFLPKYNYIDYTFINCSNLINIVNVKNRKLVCEN